MTTDRKVLATKVFKSQPYPIIRGVGGLGEALGEVLEAFEGEARKVDAGTNDIHSMEQAQTLAAAAILGGQPAAAHIGRLFYWNPYMYLNADKVRDLVQVVEEELA